MANGSRLHRRSIRNSCAPGCCARTRSSTITGRTSCISTILACRSARRASRRLRIITTRRWREFGEGPTKPPPPGMFSENQLKPFTADDVRFTKKGETLYAIFLDWPQGESAIASLGGNALPGAVIERIDLLGGSQLEFR